MLASLARPSGACGRRCLGARGLWQEGAAAGAGGRAAAAQQHTDAAADGARLWEKRYSGPGGGYTNNQAQAVKDFQDQTKALSANVSSFSAVLTSLAESLSAYLPSATQSTVGAAVRASQAAAQERASRVA